MPVESHTQKYRIVECNPERPRRFRRGKTGCITCKVRRVRCDEQKPECNRCVSTGRKCDGYQPISPRNSPSGSHQITSSTSTEALRKQLRIALPKKNDQEIRSFRYFLDVTAPTIAGVFEAEFWLTYIPRACHLDSTIWHAVVALGAVHETSTKTTGSTAGSGTTFALQQINAAINHLVRPKTPSSGQEQNWRALTTSVVFTYLCSFQGLYSDAAIHLSAAKHLIQELHEMRKTPTRSTFSRSTNRRITDTVPSTFDRAPVPYYDLFSVVACLEVTAQLLNSSTDSVGRELLSDASAYITWRTYSAPSIPASSETCEHGRCHPSRATPSNLSHAGRAIKSLLNGLMAMSQRNGREVARLVLHGEESVLAALIRRQQPYVRAYHELSTAIDAFVLDTFAECTCFNSITTPKKSQKKAVDVLRMYHATCFPLFLDSPTDMFPLNTTYHPVLAASESSARGLVYRRGRGGILLRDSPSNSPPAIGDTYLKDLQATNPILDEQEILSIHFEQALTLAESILHEPISQTRSENPSDFVPTLPTTTPLLILANISGITPELRKQVVHLLREYPQQEVLHDSTFAAALCELILGLEASDRHGTLEIEGASPETALSNKTYGANVTFTDTHQARVEIQTWDDWLAERPGREETLLW
ncbi:C6 zinc finger domain protein [Paraphaeosphaeria sporulosa]